MTTKADSFYDSDFGNASVLYDGDGNTNEGLFARPVGFREGDSLEVTDVRPTGTSFLLTTKVVDSSEKSGPTIVLNEDEIFEIQGRNRVSVGDMLRRKKKGFFEATQKWEGRVESIGKESFVASVVDLTEKSVNDGTVEIDFIEMSEEDKDMLKVGAIFYWNVGHYYTPDGNRSTLSMIKFRRLPRLSSRYKKKVKDKAKTFFALHFPKNNK